jgi:hypothetical protein
MRRASVLLAVASALSVAAIAGQRGTGVPSGAGGVVQAPSAPVYPAQTGPQGPVQARPPRVQRPPDFDQKVPKEKRLKKRFDAATARKQAEQLAELTRKLPDEIDAVSKGVLPKDLVEQLKKVQKLAKQLRSEVSQ